MAEPFLSEIMMVAFDYAPIGWALADGQILKINQNKALFTLIGTTYGGDGKETFALPDFRGRTAIHVGNGHTLGESGGEAAHQLTDSELPEHTHTLNAFDDGSTDLNVIKPASHFFANSKPSELYSNAPGKDSMVSLRAGSCSVTGNNEPHLNMQPFLAINFCIALTGIWPVRP